MKNAYLCKDCPEWSVFDFESEAYQRGVEHKNATGHQVAVMEMSDSPIDREAEYVAWRASLVTTPTLFEQPTDEPPNDAEFDGSDYESSMDRERLTGQLLRVWSAMSDGAWRTVDEVVAITGDGAVSVQSQLRHLRKERFGAYLVEKRQRSPGLWEWRVGAKGAGTPGHVHCRGCDERDAEIERLQRIIESQKVSSA